MATPVRARLTLAVRTPYQWSRLSGEYHLSSQLVMGAGAAGRIAAVAPFLVRRSVIYSQPTTPAVIPTQAGITLCSQHMLT